MAKRNVRLSSLKKAAPRQTTYYSPNPEYQIIYPAPPHPPLEPHYTVPYTHLLDPPYTTMTDPPMWWGVDAPVDGKTYGRQNAEWVEVLSTSTAAGANLTYYNGMLNAGIPTGSTNTVLLTDGSGNTRYDYNITNAGAHTMTAGGLYVEGSVRTAAVAVAVLPSPGHMGARNFVTDSVQTLSAGMGSIVTGGGTNNVPVYDDGTNWRIGG